MFRTATTAGWPIWRNAGFDVFSMDTTGYGRSTRPAAMNDPCNLSAEQQKQFVPALIAKPCAPSYPQSADDDRLGLERHRRRGGLHPRAAARRARQPGGLVARRTARRPVTPRRTPTRCEKLVLLAPAYRPRRAGGRNRRCPPPASASTRSRAPSSIANWDRQVGCPEQYDPAASANRCGPACSRPIRSAPPGARRAARAADDDAGAGTRR